MKFLKEIIEQNHKKIISLYEQEMISSFNKGRDLIQLNYDNNDSSQNYYSKFEKLGLINGNKAHEPHMVLDVIPSSIEFYKKFYGESYSLLTLNQIKYYKKKYGTIFCEESVPLYNLLTDEDVKKMISYTKNFVKRELFPHYKIYFIHRNVSNSFFKTDVERPLIVGQIIENETYPLFVLIT